MTDRSEASSGAPERDDSLAEQTHDPDTAIVDDTRELEDTVQEVADDVTEGWHRMRTVIGPY